MMKNLKCLASALILTTSMTIATTAHAASEYIVTHGLQAQESVWLRNKKIQKREVYMLGYQNSESRWLERAVPKSEYASLVKDLKAMRAEMAKQQLQHPNPFCRTMIQIQEAGKPVRFCPEALTTASQKKLSLWMKAQSELVIGL